ncbi:IFT57-like protein [Mya arenaria]|uniref:IFT57-like protein n=1 Tax=Mya arenaria TaxID=6604 RepID=A0ABY7E809_MYAAR|nr:IFT57-like protein [Mya arenaria]
MRTRTRVAEGSGVDDRGRHGDRDSRNKGLPENKLWVRENPECSVTDVTALQSFAYMSSHIIMSDDKRRGEESVEDGGPGLVYMPFVVNEELLDKLRLLNYETEFIKPLNMKNFSRHYFAIATNSGEQFFMFTSLSAWLLRLAGRDFEQPQENYSVDFPPSKLKQGAGEHCLYILDRLADEALKHTNFRWGKPEYPEEEMEEENIVEDDAELTLNKVEDNIFGAGGDEDEFEDDEPMMDLEGLRKLNQKDWRVHVEQMHQHKDGIETSLTETKTYLDKLHDEITRTLEKISSREKCVNIVTIVSQVSEELEKVKMEMDDRGSSMTDGGHNNNNNNNNNSSNNDNNNDNNNKIYV